MTYGKLKQFRRDRLYASDRDRTIAFNEILKKNRINDDQQMCATCIGHGNYGTANRTTGGKNNTDAHKGSSPSKISPTKTSNTQGTKFNDSSHTNNGQVMTQISAIYAKRSRSILNQFGQSNIQHGHGGHGTSNPVYLNPNSNINAGRGSVGNTNNHNHDANDHAHNNAKGSPRLGRLRGISP